MAVLATRCFGNSHRMHPLTYEQARRERGVFHATPIEQWHKAAGIIDLARGAACRRFDDSRLQSPEDPGCLCLPERQQPLAGGDEAGNGLMKIRKHGAIFLDSERPAPEPGCRAGMN